MITILYYGKLADVTGVFSERLDVPDGIQATDALARWLEEVRGCHGALTARSVRMALNDTILTAPCALRPGDEVAFLPPVGGG